MTGTVAPGDNAVGQLTTNIVDFASNDGTLLIDIPAIGSAGTNYDLLTATGTVSLDGGSICSYDLTGLSLSGTVDFTIVSAATVSGSFGALNQVANPNSYSVTQIASATSIILRISDDSTPPTISSITTRDSDGDGHLDQCEILFDEAIKDNTVEAADFSLSDSYVISGWSTGTANDDTIFLTLNEKGSYDTGITPTLSYDDAASGSAALSDSTGNLLVDITNQSSSDGAAAILTASDWVDADSNGVDAGDTMSLSFSESVSSSSVLIADIGLAVNSDTLNSSSIADQSSSSINLILAGTPLLCPGGTYSNAALDAGDPSGVFINNGTRITDAAGNPTATGNGTTAVDLGPSSQDLAIEWSTGGSLDKTWALGALTLGTIKNSVDDPALDLGITNVGNHSVQVSVDTSTSSSGWTVGNTMAANVFLMKADTAPATANDPAAYALELSSSAQQLTPLLYSGNAQTLDILFRAPQALTIGGGVVQSITITITVSLPP